MVHLTWRLTASGEGALEDEHGEDLAHAIPDSHLTETGASSHFFWFGASRLLVADVVGAFLTE